MRIREAELGDENPIAVVNERSVHQITAADYKNDIVEAWVTPPEVKTADEGEEPPRWSNEPRRRRGRTGRRSSPGRPAVRSGGASLRLRRNSPHRRWLRRRRATGVPGQASGRRRRARRVRRSRPRRGRRRLSTPMPTRGRGTGLQPGLDRLLTSINAREFYEYHEYETLAERTFDFGGGVEGPAMVMRGEL